jgi:dihydrofolate reductase
MITLIGAIGLNRELGKDNQLLWKLPNDLKFFKQQTEGNVVVMGRNTLKSLNDKPLPNRINVVLTKDKTFNSTSLPIHYIDNTLEDALDTINLLSHKEIFIIGGQSIYEQFLPYADKILLTIVDNKFPEADTFFPEISDEWILEHSTRNLADEKHAYDYYFCTYRKKKDLIPKRLTKTN